MRTPLALIALFASTSVYAAITGYIATEEGKPIQGAKVTAYERETDLTLRARVVSQSPERVAVVTATTNEEGFFSIDPKLGTVDLVFTAAGRQAEVGEAANGENAGTLILATAKPRRGRVMSAGKGVPNAVLLNARSVTVRADAEGYYDVAQFSSLAPPTIVIHPEYAIGDVTAFNRETGNATLRRGVSVQGRVLAEDRETPVPNAIVRVDGWPLAKSGEDGSFTIAHAADQWRTVSAHDEKRAGRSPRTRAQTYTIVLAPAATIAGTVRVDKTNVPLPGARILMFQQSEPLIAPVAITDAKGNFSHSGLAPGSYMVSVIAAGFSGMPASVEVASGATVQRTITVTQLPRFSGTVIDEERKPVRAAVIHSSFNPAGASGVDGRFSIAMRPSGQPAYYVVRKTGYAPAVVGPISTQSESRPVTVTMTKGFPFQLHVEDRSGSPVADEPVTIAIPGDDGTPQPRVFICGDRRGTPQCHTDGKGMVEMPLVEGEYEIIVGGEKVPVKRLPAQLLSRRNATVTVTVDRGVEVSGRVTYTDGSPIGSTTVHIFAKEVNLRQTGQGDPLNADGTFVLKNVPAGPITLYTRTQNAEIEGPSVEITAPAKDVVLTMPQPLRIEGRVVDRGSNQPVRDFTIGIRRFRGGGWGVNSRSFSSDEGAFMMDDIQPGSIELTVAAPGYAPGNVSAAALAEKSPITVQLDRGAVVFGRVSADGSPVADANVSFFTASRLISGQRMTATTDSQGEFRFDSAMSGEYTVSVFKKGFAPTRKTVEVSSTRETRVDLELKRGGELQGRVVDSEGQAVAGARVSARGAAAPSTMSDVDGTFKIEGIAEGMYTVRAEKSGYIEASVDDVQVPKSQQITLTLRKGGTISGRVTGLSQRDLALTRVTAGYDPSSGARVDASGAFTITGVPDGVVRVQATVQGTPSRSSAAKTVEVTNGSAPRVELDFTGNFAVTGRVMRAGAPLASAMVRFEGVPSTAAPSIATTSSDGRYEVSLTTASDYKIGVDFGPSGNFDVGRVHIGGPMTYDIDVRGGGVTGRVIDAQSGTPIAGASLGMVRPSGRGTTVMSDSDGRFSFDLVTAGRYTIRANKTLYSSESQDVDVREGVPANVEFRLSQGERVAFRVVDVSTGRLLDAVSISIADAAGKTVQSGPSTRDDNGLWRVWVAPGRYKVRVFVRGFSPQTADFTAPGPDITVLMREGGRIVLQGIGDGAVRARLLDAQTRKSVMGVGVPPAAFEPVQPGSYIVELLDRSGVVLSSKPVTLTGADTITVQMN